MKRKYADSPNWDKIQDKKFLNKYFYNEEFKGNICLLTDIKVKEKIVVKEDNKEIILMDDNYKWLKIYPEKTKNIAISVAISDKNEIIEWYFDIAKNSGITKDGIPYIDDLYLDVILYPSGVVKLIDEDELKEALLNNKIEKEDFELAYDVADNLITNINGKMQQLNDFTNKYYKYFCQ